jgi:hypothetical protein
LNLNKRNASLIVKIFNRGFDRRLSLFRFTVAEAESMIAEFAFAPFAGEKTLVQWQTLSVLLLMK